MSKMSKMKFECVDHSAEPALAQSPLTLDELDELSRTHPPTPTPCSSSTPPWFVGHWRDWHRGHGCAQDDGQPRSDAATIEIEQHAANATTGRLTDAELRFLRAATTSGDTLLVRALDELTARRAGTAVENLTNTELNSVRGSASSSRDEILKRAIHELTARRSTTERR